MSVKELFLAAMKAALNDESLVWDESVSIEEWQNFFDLSIKQNVLPLVYQSIYSSQAFKETGMPLANLYKGQIMRIVFAQIQRTREFLQLYQKLSEQGMMPIVVKGIMCRILLKNGDNRPSGDEDLFIPAGTYDTYKRILTECGMEIAPWDAQKENQLHEVSYIYKSGSLSVEVHKDLFDRELSAFKGMNQLFSDAFEKSIVIEIDGTPIRTMNHTDHMLFLILHAFKHFVSSGFGIRQIADMTTFANARGKEIDWEKLLADCKSIRADIFAASIFDIGIRYLGMDVEKSAFPQCWQMIEVNSDRMLSDVLDAGIFGDSNMSRKHSANMTLNAVSSDKEGKAARGSVFRTIFPPVSVLQNRYSWLSEKPWLLPLAWADRILKYRKESANGKNNNAADSIRIGNDRVELMREYGIIGKRNT